MVSDPLIGKVLHNKYHLVRLLGRGGMGAVYEAVHCELDSTVAIKMLLPAVAENGEAFERFRREARAASKLRHPHIAQVMDFDYAEEGVPYIVMEYLDGESLADLLEREGTLPLDRTLAICQGVLEAVEAAHVQGIIHRDLKPQNIFLCRQAELQVPKVLDFGISKVLDATSALTNTESLMGTPCYMAPEQAEGRSGEADSRTDVFALGAILYRALGGREAFGGGKPLSIIYKVVHQDPEPLAQLNPAVNPAVAGVVHRAMAKAPDGRYPSAAALWRALEAAAGRGEPLGDSRSPGGLSPGGEIPGGFSRPPSRPTSSPWRHTALFLGAGVLVVLAGLGVWKQLDRDGAGGAASPPESTSREASPVDPPGAPPPENVGAPREKHPEQATTVDARLPPAPGTKKKKKATPSPRRPGHAGRSRGKATHKTKREQKPQKRPDARPPSPPTLKAPPPEPDEAGDNTLPMQPKAR